MMIRLKVKTVIDFLKKNKAPSAFAAGKKQKELCLQKKKVPDGTP